MLGGHPSNLVPLCVACEDLEDQAHRDYGELAVRPQTPHDLRARVEGVTRILAVEGDAVRAVEDPRAGRQRTLTNFLNHHPAGRKFRELIGRGLDREAVVGLIARWPGSRPEVVRIIQDKQGTT